MPEPWFNAEDYSLDTHGLTSFFHMTAEAAISLEADTWPKEKIDAFVALIVRHEGYWHQAEESFWQLRCTYNAEHLPANWSPGICYLYEKTRLYRASKGMDFSTSTSDMREAQQMNQRMILERLAGFFGGIAPFPDGGQQQQIETISAMLHSFAMASLTVPAAPVATGSEYKGPEPGLGVDANISGNPGIPRGETDPKKADSTPGQTKKAPMHEKAKPTPPHIVTRTGLRNAGNTCYQNALFQALCKTKALISLLQSTVDFLHDEREKNFARLLISLHEGCTKTTEDSLFQFWRDVDELASANRTWKPFTKKEMQQQDCAEFFEMLTGSFCPSLASIFPLLSLNVTYKCRDCNAERLMEPDRIQLVDVHIPDGPGDTQFKVEDLLPFAEWVAIDQDNHVSDLCDGNVHHVQQETRSMPTEWPDHLIIQIKRFEWVDTDEPVWKKQDMIQYPIHRLTVPGGVQYAVQSVICHIGATADRGHYYAISRETQEEDSPWFRYDDAISREIPNGSRHEEIVTSDAYLIFLEKVVEDTDMLDVSTMGIESSDPTIAEQVRKKKLEAVDVATTVSAATHPTLPREPKAAEKSKVPESSKVALHEMLGRTNKEGNVRPSTKGLHPLDTNLSPPINHSDIESRLHDEAKGVHESSNRLDIQSDYNEKGKTTMVLKSVRHYSDNDTIPDTESEHEALSQATVRDRTPLVLNSEPARVAPRQPRHYSDDETIPETASEQETQSPGIQSDGPTRARIQHAFNSNLAQAMREHKSASSKSMLLSGNRPHHRRPDANSRAMKAGSWRQGDIRQMFRSATARGPTRAFPTAGEAPIAPAAENSPGSRVTAGSHDVPTLGVSGRDMWEDRKVALRSKVPFHDLVGRMYSLESHREVMAKSDAEPTSDSNDSATRK